MLLSFHPPPPSRPPAPPLPHTLQLVGISWMETIHGKKVTLYSDTSFKVMTFTLINWANQICDVLFMVHVPLSHWACIVLLCNAMCPLCQKWHMIAVNIGLPVSVAIMWYINYVEQICDLSPMTCAGQHQCACIVIWCNELCPGCKMCQAPVIGCHR